MKKFFKWFFTGAIVLLVVGELCARLLFGLGNPPLFEASDEYGYRFMPNQDIYRFGNRIYFNSNGLRSEEISEEPASGITRILCIGDSITYGGTLTDQEETYPYILERLLNENNNTRFEVLNASAPSWGIQNEEVYLRKFGLYNSSIVVLQLGRGDLFSPKSSSEVVGRSATYPNKKFTFALGEVLSRHVFSKGKAIRTKENKTLTPSKILEDNMQSLERIAELIRNNKASLIVIYVPNMQEIKNNHFLLQPVDKTLYDTVEKLNAPFLNFTDEFEGFGNGEAFRDQVHPNPDGNRIIAKVLADLILNGLNK